MLDVASGNIGSHVMESLLTSAGGSGAGAPPPEAWQRYLIDTMTAISGPLVRNMLGKIGLDASAAAPFALLDHGCGLGAVAAVLMETVPRRVLASSRVLCGDHSEALVEAVRARGEREGWVGCEARVVDAQDSGLPSESFTHVVGNIMFHTVPDSEAALRDSIRILKPGGTLALTTWHASNTSWITHVRDAFATFPADLLPPSYAFDLPMQTSPWGRWHDVDWLRATLSRPDRGCGLEGVRVEVLASTWPVASVDDFLRAYGTMVDLAADVVLGAESVARLGGHEGVRERVRAYLAGRFGRQGEEVEEEEGWTLVGVSICAWGRKRAE